MNRHLPFFLSLAALSATLLACAPSSCPAGEDSSKGSVEPTQTYKVRTLDVYRSNKEVDTRMSFRFYDATPNIPYVSVRDYYRDFFKLDLTRTVEGGVFTYALGKDAYLRFDPALDIVGICNVNAFSSNPDSAESNAITFLRNEKTSSTTLRELTVSLKDYSIDVHGDDEAYVPLSFLSSFSGGINGYQVAYNGSDVFVFDVFGGVTGKQRGLSHYGSLYTDALEKKTPRPKDVAEYTYGQLCFNMDHLRGYTNQMIFGDNNLLTMGFNGLLEHYYPELKALLLSQDKQKYYFGHYVAFEGLADGGHTVSEAARLSFISETKGMLNDYPNLKALSTQSLLVQTQSTMNETGYTRSKTAAFPDHYGPSGDERKTDYYIYNAESKTAYIGFDSFTFDFQGWDKYYKNGKKAEDVPENDTFAFVRKSLYHALQDKAVNVVLDLSTNGGGSSGALVGIYGLFNRGKTNLSTNNVIDHSRQTVSWDVDINLDGVIDEHDAAESDKFKSFKLAVLTSPMAFSCGNLMPSRLKELGAKVVGQRSGGGGCAIVYEATPDGLTYYRSSHLCLSNTKGENIDSGVPCDYEIEVTKTPVATMPSVYSVEAPKFYDFKTIAAYLATVK